MELYYSPFACSLAPHIVCREANLPVTLRRVDLATKRAENCTDFAELNPLTQVPTLVLDDGQVLTENLAVLMWLGSQAPERGLVPPPGTPAHYQVLRWLSLISTELHKHVLFRVLALIAVDDEKPRARAAAAAPLAALERHLAGGAQELVGNQFTIADAHLTWALTIMPAAGVPLEPYPAVHAYLARHQQRPSIAAAIELERREYKQAKRASM
jgi:glutathione S-transferase